MKRKHGLFGSTPSTEGVSLACPAPSSAKRAEDEQYPEVTAQPSGGWPGGQRSACYAGSKSPPGRAPWEVGSTGRSSPQDPCQVSLELGRPLLEQVTRTASLPGVPGLQEPGSPVLRGMRFLAHSGVSSSIPLCAPAA